MERKIKRILSVFLCAVMIFSTANAAFAAETRAVVDSGFCGAQGENLTWTLYDDGELVISGEGEMDWYYAEWHSSNSPQLIKNPPWYGYYDVIEVITVEEGVESIGNDAFSAEKIDYYRVNLPASLKFIESRSSYKNPFDGADGKQDTSRVRVFCTPLSIGDFTYIENRIYSYGYKAETGVERSLKQTATRVNLNDFPKDVVYYSGEEPEYFCEIYQRDHDFAPQEKGDITSYFVRYYAGGLDDIQIRWTTEGDAYDAVYNENRDTGLLTTADFTAARYGNYYITVDLLDAQGNVLSSAKARLFFDFEEDMTFEEKVEDKISTMKAELWLLSYFAVYFISGIVISPFTSLFGLVSALLEKFQGMI